MVMNRHVGAGHLNLGPLEEALSHPHSRAIIHACIHACIYTHIHIYIYVCIALHESLLYIFNWTVLSLKQFFLPLTKSGNKRMLLTSGKFWDLTNHSAMYRGKNLPTTYLDWYANSAAIKNLAWGGHMDEPSQELNIKWWWAKSKLIHSTLSCP